MFLTRQPNLKTKIEKKWIVSMSFHRLNNNWEFVVFKNTQISIDKNIIILIGNLRLEKYWESLKVDQIGKHCNFIQSGFR